MHKNKTHNKQLQTSHNYEGYDSFGAVFRKTTDIIVNGIALPVGIAGSCLDVYARVAQGVKGFTYFDALTIGFLSIPMVKKTFDISIDNLKESITFKDKTLRKVSYAGIYSSTTYAIFTGIAAYSVLSQKISVDVFSKMPSDSRTLFILGIGAACVGFGAAIRGKTKKIEGYKRI